MIKPYTFHKTFLLLPLLLITYFCQAQKTDTAYYHQGETYHWVAGSFGGASNCITVAGSVNVLMDNGYLLSAQYMDGAGILARPGEMAEINEYTLYLGRKLTRGRYGNFFFMAGPSIVHFNKRSNDILGYNPQHFPVYADNELSTIVGLPVNVRYLVSPAKFLGFNIDAGVNLNLKHIYGSIQIGIALGKLRSAPHYR